MQYNYTGQMHEGAKVFEANGSLYTNKHGIADIFVEAVTTDDYSRGDAKYSNSDLIKPAKAVIIERVHQAEIINDVSDIFARLRGHGLHAVLERFANPNSIAEKRLFMEIAGIKITTKPDHYDTDISDLSDYKSTSVYSFLLGDKPEWEQQLNVGAHFLRANGYSPKKLTIHAMLYDWSRNRAKRDPDYIQSPFHSVDIPLWPELEAEGFIVGCIAGLKRLEHHYAEGLVLPDCTPDERWEEPTKYAVMKTGRKSALRVLDSKEAAIKYMEEMGGTRIDTRHGEAKRCKLYCDAHPWCEQFKQESNSQ